jgi:hypothetical protein
MKKAILILIIVLAGQLISFCYAQRLTKDIKYVHFNNTDMRPYFSTSKVDAEIYYKDFDSPMRLTYDTTANKIQGLQYFDKENELELKAFFIVKDNHRMDTVVYTRPLPSYDMLDTIMAVYDAMNFGTWEYYNTKGEIYKKEIYKKGILNKTFQLNDKGEMIEVKNKK